MRTEADAATESPNPSEEPGARRPAPTERPAWREGAVLVGVVLGTRLLLLAVVGLLTHGREFTDDAPMLLGLARHPFEILSGITARYGQHPPFLGLLEAVVALPARAVLPDFYAIRVALAVWESVGAVFAYLALRALVPAGPARRWALAGVVVLPIGWMTSVVMAQDEVIAATWVAAVLWLVATRRSTAALVVCGLGVVAGKIFLGVPLVVLILLLRHRSLVYRTVVGLAPVVVTYGWVVAAAVARGNDIPLLGFDPDAKFGVNLWVLLGVEAKTSRRVSEILVLAAVMVVIGLVHRARVDPVPPVLTAVILATLLWTYTAFYHVNPEYYVLLLVAGLALARRPAERVLVALLFSVPWAVNVFYGIDNPTSHTGEKARIAAFLAPRLPGGPHPWFLASVWACIVVTVAAAVWATNQAFNLPASHSSDRR